MDNAEQNEEQLPLVDGNARNARETRDQIIRDYYTWVSLLENHLNDIK